jgi:hypothetical protein
MSIDQKHKKNPHFHVSRDFIEDEVLKNQFSNVLIRSKDACNSRKIKTWDPIIKC